MEGLRKTQKATSSNYIGTVTMKSRMENALTLMDSVLAKPPPVQFAPKKIATTQSSRLPPERRKTTAKFNPLDTRPQIIFDED